MTFDNKCEFCDATKMSHHSFTWICDDCRAKIKMNEKIVKELEYRKKHPQAFNYAQFEVWVTDILAGGNGFPVPKEFLGEKD